MPGHPDRLRLGLALLASLCLHAVLLLNGSSRSTVRVGAATLNSQVLTLRPPAPSSLSPTAPASDTNRLPTHEPQTSHPDLQGYHSAAQLTHPPRPLRDVDLDLPESRLLTSPGRLLLTLWIDEQGRVMSFQVEATGLPEEYTTAVAEAFASLRFSPGEILGRKVASTLKLEINHDMPVESSP